MTTALPLTIELSKEFICKLNNILQIIFHYISKKIEEGRPGIVARGYGNGPWDGRRGFEAR